MRRSVWKYPEQGERVVGTRGGTEFDFSWPALGKGNRNRATVKVDQQWVSRRARDIFRVEEDRYVVAVRKVVSAKDDPDVRRGETKERLPYAIVDTVSGGPVKRRRITLRTLVAQYVRIAEPVRQLVGREALVSEPPKPEKKPALVRLSPEALAKQAIDLVEKMEAKASAAERWAREKGSTKREAAARDLAELQKLQQLVLAAWGTEEEARERAVAFMRRNPGVSTTDVAFLARVPASSASAWKAHLTRGTYEAAE